MIVVVEGMYLGHAGKVVGTKPSRSWLVRLDNGDILTIPEEHLEKV